MLRQLANLPKHPESVPINLLVQVEGTPLYGPDDLDPFEFVRTIAAGAHPHARSYVRLSAGRSEMTDELQALCFLAGANSMFYGERLLTTANAESDRDRRCSSVWGFASRRWMRGSAAEPRALHRRQVTGRFAADLQLDHGSRPPSWIAGSRRHLYRARRARRSPGAAASIDGRGCSPSAATTTWGWPVIRTCRGAQAGCGPVRRRQRRGTSGHGAQRRPPRPGARAGGLHSQARALLFSTGYMANLGVISALAGAAIRCSRTD